MSPKGLKWNGGELSLEKCRVMGILNVTPDSFSDGGAHLSVDEAVRHAWQIANEGADILDVGGESTRPGAKPVNLKAERDRVWPILQRLKEEKYPLPISLDSVKSDLAEEALEGSYAQIINDVEGLRNPKMVEIVKKYEAPVILMHMFGQPRTMQSEYHYEDVVEDLITFFRQRLKDVGIEKNVVIDPGIGFGKSVDHNLQILRRLKEFDVIGHPVLIGASRKSFIGKVLDLPVEDRLEGSLAAAVIAAYNGASIIRAHDVSQTVRAVHLVQSALQGNWVPSAPRAEI